MLGYLSADIICSEKRTVRSRKTVSFEEQIMSKVKYPRIFSRYMKAIVFKSFFAIWAVLKNERISLGYSPVLARGVGGFSHVIRLNQSCVVENIWIIISAMSLLSRGSVSIGSFQGGEVDSAMTMDSKDFVKLFMGQ